MGFILGKAKPDHGTDRVIWTIASQLHQAATEPNGQGKLALR